MYMKRCVCAVPLYPGSSYPYGAADESTAVVDLQHALKQLVTGRLVCGVLALLQVHRLRHPPCEVHQGIGRVPSVQRLIAAVEPDGQGQINNPPAKQ